MNLVFSSPWLIHVFALVILGSLLIILLAHRRWQDALQIRFALYLGLAWLSSAAFVASFGAWAFGEIRAGLLRFHFYTLVALPLFYFITARAYIGLERRPQSYVIGIALLVSLLAVDGFQSRLLVGNAIIETDELIIGLRALLWLICNCWILLIGSREFLRLPSPLHRNRLKYLGTASIFLFADGALAMRGDFFSLAAAVGLQIVGMLILAYATYRHSLVDLWMVIRRALFFVLATAFTIAVYFMAIQILFSAGQDQDASRQWVGVLFTAAILALLVQPVRNYFQHLTETILFGRNYDVHSIVGEFSHRLAARIELNEFAQEGRQLLQRAIGAREARLLVFERDAAGYAIQVLPQSPTPALLHLMDESSFVRTLTTRDAPLMQFDIDRLPEYIDLAPATREQLRQLNGEVYLPIKRNAALIGAWVVGAKASGDTYDDRDLTLLTTLAGQSAVALENARLLSDLRLQVSEVRSMRDYLDSTMASIATGVLTLDYENKIISFNRAAENIFRVPAAQAIGKRYDAVLPNLEGAQLSSLIARLWAKGAQQLARDAVAQVAERGQVHLTLRLSPLRHAEKMVGIAMVVEDLTEQARLEKERRAEEQEKQRIRDTFEHYVAPTVVEGLLADPRRAQLGGERQMVSILFADIHGFSNLSEQLPPEELVDVLNGYLAAAYRVILQFEGTIDKYMGDGMMAIFNAPTPQPDHAWRAASAALMLHQEIAKFAEQLPRSQRLNFRVGLHTGEAIVGNIGARDLMNYTAIGDTVNVAKRLQENAPPGLTLISRSTFTLIEERSHVTQRQVLTIRGRSAPVEVFELSDLR